MEKLAKCNECEKIFSVEEIKTVKGLVGEFWGTPAYQIEYVCPHCGSEDMEEAHLCQFCGEDTGDRFIDLCPKCIHSQDNNLDLWYGICEEQRIVDKVNVNSALASQFTEAQINALLYEKLKERHRQNPANVNLSAFVGDDPQWSAAMLIDKEVK